MRHVSPGDLRRAIDEPSSLSSPQRSHLEACARCRTRERDVAASATRAARAFAMTPNPEAALGGARSRVAERLRDVPRAGARRSPLRLTMPFATASLATAAACVAFVAASSPLRSVAENFLGVFAPDSVAAIALDPHDVANLRELRGLTGYGFVRLRHDGGTAYGVPGIAQASVAVHFPVSAPRYLPDSAPHVPRFVVSDRIVTDFTFSAPLAERSALAAGTVAPPMPSALDGTTLEAGFGPTVVTTYDAPSVPAALPGDVVALATESGPPPRLAIVQLPVPHVVSSGASAGAIESYLLEQPGISAHLATQLASIGDLTTTLPIPVPIDRAFARAALVRGNSGITFGDETSGLAGAIWQERGMLYVVYGSLPLHEISAVANSLI